MARIFWITERHTGDEGGMAVSSNRLVSSLRDRGHSLTVLHLAASSRQSPFRLGSVEGGLRVEGWQGDLERLFFHNRPVMEKNDVLAGFGGGLPGYLATLWAKWLGARSVVLFRGNDLDRLSHDAGRGWMMHEALRGADLVGAVAREMCSRISALREGPVIFTPTGIIPDEWAVFPVDHDLAAQLRARHSPDGRPLIGMFGQLKYKKGLFTAIEVFREYGFGRRARLLTVGDLPDAERAELEATCVDFWRGEPFIERGDLPPRYLACDVVFIPSLFEGMPNVMLEAMACGSVVVASRAGGIPDVIRDGVDGFLFEAGDAVAAANTLARALSLVPEVRRQIREAARETVTSRFTAAHEADILESALHSLAIRPEGS